ncbi:MAG TPA: hypothetical protein VJ276_23700, partial [Thermoanaerobaculia bacterium]|nr:hypothetical protein [Thermoanaerobaculia bacterium]
WDELRTIAENEFDAEISIHLHPVGGEYHGKPIVPFGHYLVEATLEEELVEQFTARADLVIADLIERHTLQVPVAVGE